MAFPADRTFLIGSLLQWWDKLSAKRDARRTDKREANAASRAAGPRKPEADQTR